VFLLPGEPSCLVLGPHGFPDLGCAHTCLFPQRKAEEAAQAAAAASAAPAPEANGTAPDQMEEDGAQPPLEGPVPIAAEPVLQKAALGVSVLRARCAGHR
jgi:hypothetical protein